MWHVLSRPTLLTAMETNSLTFMTERGIYNPFRWNTQTRHCRLMNQNHFINPLLPPGLSKEIDYCRVDLMLKGDDIYFSEITLSPKEANLKSPHQFGTQNSAVCGICLLLKQVRSSLCIHALKQAMRV
nr:Uncharacterised protein [Klebsiella pneumoniae]